MIRKGAPQAFLGVVYGLLMAVCVARFFAPSPFLYSRFS